jgi:hypothetical protein
MDVGKPEVGWDYWRNPLPENLMAEWRRSWLRIQSLNRNFF